MSSSVFLAISLPPRPKAMLTVKTIRVIKPMNIIKIRV
jgi:hypothetical protein